jgi:hypothetical protein
MYEVVPTLIGATRINNVPDLHLPILSQFEFDSLSRFVSSALLLLDDPDTKLIGECSFRPITFCPRFNGGEVSNRVNVGPQFHFATERIVRRECQNRRPRTLAGGVTPKTCL